MEILLRESDGKDFYFPVNPEEIRISRGKGYETVNILSLGEFDFPTGEKVKEIAFSSFFPAAYDSYCNYKDIPDPLEAMQTLTKMTASKQPVRLIITETPVNVLVLISAHDTTFKGGEPGDVYFDLTARTWREVKVHTKVAPTTTASATKQATKTARADTKKPAKTYVVRSGDSLSKIAKLELGNSSKWQAIYNLNKKMIGPDPNKIKPGQKLVMPS
jgi:nucleoid-associated protein YgaU